MLANSKMLLAKASISSHYLALFGSISENLISTNLNWHCLTKLAQTLLSLQIVAYNHYHGNATVGKHLLVNASNLLA